MRTYRRLALLYESLQRLTDVLTISIPKVDLKQFKGLAKAMGWVFEKKETEIKAVDTEEWRAEQEREAFLHTSRINAAKMCAKYL